MSFRLQAKHLSITYPQASFALEDGLTFLRNKSSGSRNVVSVVICSETHADGSFHRHAYVKYSARINVTNPRFFDFAGCHPNVQSTTNVNAWLNYIREDGDFLEWHAEESSGGIYENAETMDERSFFEWALANRVPYGFAQRAWDSSRKAVNQITFSDDNNPFLDLNLPLSRELANYHLSTDLTNILVGPTGCGKTVYAFRNLVKPMLMISHIDDLKYLDPTLHRSILFDDMKFDHMPIQAQIHLCDRGLPRSIHRRYGTTLIPPGIQVLITCNELPFAWDPAIARRCHQLQIHDI